MRFLQAHGFKRFASHVTSYIPRRKGQPTHRPPPRIALRGRGVEGKYISNVRPVIRRRSMRDARRAMAEMPRSPGPASLW